VEISTAENEKRVSMVYERAMAAVHAGNEISDQEDFVYQVELLSQEVNSGASFEQYFRWVGKTELDAILDHLKQLDLPEVDSVVEQAIRVAFPSGVPDDEDDYEECTDWTEKQERQLEELFEEFKKFNGVITNKLGRFIEANKLA
jgi:hypothetical protein